MSVKRQGRRAKREIRSRRVVAPRLPRRVHVSMLDDAGCGEMHAAVKAILWDIGIAVCDAATRRRLTLEQKCLEGEGDYLRIPPDLVERALSTVSPSVRLHGRDGTLALDTSEAFPRFGPGVNCINTLDHETGEHRPCTLADIRRTGKVCEALDNIDMAMSLGYPSDVDPEIEAVETVRGLSQSTQKPISFTGHDEVMVEAIWAYLAERSGGWDALAEKPCGIDLTGPLSPLRIGEETCRRLEFAAERNLPIVCYPALFPGMSGPITFAGSIAQSSAEAIAGVVISQTIRPGAPIMSGTAVLPMDMRQANLAYGSPEYALAGLGASEYFNFIGLPNWVAAGCSDAHLPDVQAAAEAGMNMSLAAMAGTSLIHNLGYLSAGRTGSLEMLVLCDELANMVTRLARGIEVNADSLALDVIKRAAPENTFVSDGHTYDRYLGEMWLPELFTRSTIENFQISEPTPLRERLRERVTEILRD